MNKKAGLSSNSFRNSLGAFFYQFIHGNMEILAKMIEIVNRRRSSPIFIEPNRRPVEAQNLPHLRLRSPRPSPEQPHHRAQGLRVDIDKLPALVREEDRTPLLEGISKTNIVVAWLCVNRVMVMEIPDCSIFIWSKCQFKFLVFTNYIEGVRVSIIFVRRERAAPLYVLDVCLCLEKNGP